MGVMETEGTILYMAFLWRRSSSAWSLWMVRRRKMRYYVKLVCIVYRCRRAWCSQSSSRHSPTRVYEGRLRKATRWLNRPGLQIAVPRVWRWEIGAAHRTRPQSRVARYCFLYLCHCWCSHSLRSCIWTFEDGPSSRLERNTVEV